MLDIQIQKTAAPKAKPAEEETPAEEAETEE